MAVFSLPDFARTCGTAVVVLVTVGGLLQMDCVLKVCLVQCISRDDAVGPGFSIGLEGIAFLAKVGAFLDVDQYVE
ncbi:hypothetical protein ACWD3I_43665 [Streptomyces sp. NPDC002817]